MMISGLSGAGGMPDFSRIQAQMQQRGAQAFGKADGDGSGGLSIDEFKTKVQDSPMAKMGGTPDASEAFGKLDGDGDGQLTQTELQDGMKQMMEKMSTQMFASLQSGGSQAATTDSRSQQLQSLQSLLAALQNGGQSQQDSRYAAVDLLA